MTWEDAFDHPLLQEEQADKILRNLRFENVRFNRESFSPLRAERSKSTKRIGHLSRTPRMRKNLTAFDYTPERVSKWRA